MKIPGQLSVQINNTRDLRAMGGYVAGSDPELDRAVEMTPKLYKVLSQSVSDPASADAFREIAAALSGGL